MSKALALQLCLLILENPLLTTATYLSLGVSHAICTAQDKFVSTGEKTTALDERSDDTPSACEWYHKDPSCHNLECQKFSAKTCLELGLSTPKPTPLLADKTGAPETLAEPGPDEVATNLGEAKRVIEQLLMGVVSEKGVALIDSLLQVVSKLHPALGTIANAFSFLTGWFGVKPPTELEQVKTALKDITGMLTTIKEKIDALEQVFGNVQVLKDFKDQRYALSNIGLSYKFYAEAPNAPNEAEFIKTCENNGMGIATASWIYREITGDDSAIPPETFYYSTAAFPTTQADDDNDNNDDSTIPPESDPRTIEPRLKNYFESSCNYTEILGRAKQVVGTFLQASQFFTFCWGVKHANLSKEVFNTTVTQRALLLDKQYAAIASNLVKILPDIKYFNGRNECYVKSIVSYAQDHQELSHQDFTDSITEYLYSQYPWLNWYAVSWSVKNGGPEEHTYLPGSLSHYMLREYKRTLFVGGQVVEDDTTWDNCTEKLGPDCFGSVLVGQTNCNAAEAFRKCIESECYKPSGTVCLKLLGASEAWGIAGSTANENQIRFARFNPDTSYLFTSTPP